LRDRFYLLIILIGLLHPFGVLAQSPAKVLLRGERLPDGLVLTNRTGSLFNPDSLSADSIRITAYYQNLGWLDCQLKHSIIEQRDRIVINYVLLKGEMYKLLLVPNIGGSQDSLDTSVKFIIDSYNNSLATSANIENLVDDILQVFADNGYPYCEITPGDFRKLDSAILQVSIAVIPGPMVTVRRIEYPGIKNLDHRFLDNYSGLKPPIAFSTAQFQAISWRLEHARFLKASSAYELRYLDCPENGIVYFPIEEVSPIILDGALGYSSNDKSLYGLANGTISNILGKGRQFGFNWLKKDKASRKLRLIYNEPLFLNQPLRLDLAVYQEDRDSLYVESGGQLGLTYTSTAALEYGLAFGASRISPEPYGRTILPGKNRRWVVINFIADTRDYSNNPKKGDYLQLEANFTNETTRRDSLFAGVSNNFRTAKLDYQRSIPLGKSQTIYARFYGRGEFSGHGSLDRQFPVGGFGNLRGYSQDIFYVMRAAILTAEYRLLTGKDGRAYIFGDMGFIQKGLGSNKTRQKAGFGIGIAAPVRTGLAIIELAAPSDEGLSSLKLHFGIKAGF
jgi:outer membrane protein assembly factor BamA